MPSGQHVLMGRCAYDALPDWERDFWKEQEVARNCIAPDIYYTDKARLAPYCILPNGKVMPHVPSDKNWNILPFAQTCCLKNHRYEIDYYFRKMVENISAGKRMESSMFAAVFGHFLQDGAQPVHLINNDFLYTLVRRPEKQYRHLHRDLDEANPDEAALKQTKPRLFGRTIPEAAFRLRAEYEKMTQQSLAQLVPLISAAYARDTETMGRLITEPYKTATFLTASAWHTAHCIAAKKFAPEELQELETVRLNKVPYSHGFTLDPYGFHPLLDFACDGKGNTIPLSLKVNSKDHGVKSTIFTNGIAMTWGNVEYDIPRNIYREFRARIGLLDSIHGQTKAIFKVVLNGRSVVYGEAMATVLDYGGPIVFDSGVMTVNDAARELVLPLKGATKITLIVECPEKNTHALWVDPVLLKGD